MGNIRRQRKSLRSPVVVVILCAGGTALARHFYSFLFYLLIPFICLRLWWRGRRAPAYRRRWRERFGFIPAIATDREVIWVHAVSVGETIAAVPLIKALQKRYPSHLVAVTTTTPTGSERVKALLGESVYHCYAPYDLPDAVNRTLRRLHPQCLVIMETELWPNLVHCCEADGIPVVVANARLSERSARGYRRFALLTRSMLSRLTLVAAQYREDGERFTALGLPGKRLAVTGNIKFDIAFTPAQQQLADQLHREWRSPRDRPVWLAASTHEGEEELVLDAFAGVRRVHPRLLLVLVPRHPERFVGVAELCRRRGYCLLRRSEGGVPDGDHDIVLGDTMGELLTMYGACDLAFVGGSLVAVGGHNLLEPAAWGKPVLSGPHLFNFSEIARLLALAEALEVCPGPTELGRGVAALLEDPEQLALRGAAARGVVEANRGSLQRLVDLIARSLA